MSRASWIIFSSTASPPTRRLCRPGADAEEVAHLVLVAARGRAGQGAVHIEAAGHLDLRQRRRALNLELRAEVAERDLRQVHAAAEVADVRHAEFVDLGRGDDPGLLDVVVVLIPHEAAVHPVDVPDQAGGVRARAE